MPVGSQTFTEIFKDKKAYTTEVKLKRILYNWVEKCENAKLLKLQLQENSSLYIQLSNNRLHTTGENTKNKALQ